MKIISIFITLFFVTISAHAEDSIVGIWLDKSKPSYQQYEFKADHDFISTVIFTDKNGKSHKNVKKGVWEIGVWNITSSTGINSKCNLSIYLDSDQCCYDIKYIADNLILTNQYGSTYGICANKVLRKPIDLLKDFPL